MSKRADRVERVTMRVTHWTIRQILRRSALIAAHDEAVAGDHAGSSQCFRSRNFNRGPPTLFRDSAGRSPASLAIYRRYFREAPKSLRHAHWVACTWIYATRTACDPCSHETGMPPDLAPLLDVELAKTWRQRRCETLASLYNAQQRKAQRDEARLAIWFVAGLYVLFAAADAVLIEDVLGYAVAARIMIGLTYGLG